MLREHLTDSVKSFSFSFVRLVKFACACSKHSSAAEDHKLQVVPTVIGKFQRDTNAYGFHLIWQLSEYRRHTSVQAVC